MPRLATLRLRGASGTDYSFKVYPLGTVFRKGLGGVYILTRRQVAESGRQRHRPLAVGNTGDLHRTRCRKAPHLPSANCICVRPENSGPARVSIRRDLSDAWGSRIGD
jgi:hypothetical protein